MFEGGDGHSVPANNIVAGTEGGDGPSVPANNIVLLTCIWHTICRS